MDPIWIRHAQDRLTLCSEEACTTVYTEAPVLCVCERFSTLFINVVGQTYCAWCVPLDTRPHLTGPQSNATVALTYTTEDV